MVDAINAVQRRALSILRAELANDVYLAGGVAVALRLGHRASKDLDLFFRATDPEAFAEPLALVPDVRIVSRAPGTLYLEVASAPVSLIRYRHQLLQEPESIRGIDVPVASIDDLLCMKLSAIAGRGAARDFWDLHGMLVAQRKPLEEALDAFRRKFATEDIGHVVRSLVYFDDAEREPRPAGLTEEYWTALKADLRAWVKAL